MGQHRRITLAALRAGQHWSFSCQEFSSQEFSSQEFSSQEFSNQGFP
jgi:hypothetical protein